jgi:type II secretory ATPase GspE/PulE/Tfp pilus assembly ATPase PilB-like protein
MLEEAARRQGYRRLAEDGLEKAIAGITTVSEVLRVVSEDALTDLEPEPVASQS